LKTLGAMGRDVGAKLHVMPHWGTVSAADVDVLGVESWIAGMVRVGSGTTTVRRAYVVLSGILSDAVKAKRLAVNPARGVENLPRQTAKRHVYLSADDVARLAEQSAERRGLVLLLAYCGLRWSEAIALRVAECRVPAAAVVGVGQRGRGGRRPRSRAEKGRKARSVPVPEFVLNELSAQCRGKAAGDLVFPGPTGGYLPRPKSTNGWFVRAVKKAKVQQKTPRGLRHTCASLAVSAGVNVLALQRMLGHASAKMTLDNYADLFDDDLDAVAVTLHGRYSREGTVPKMCPRGSTDDG
jgi:integrase